MVTDATVFISANGRALFRRNARAALSTARDATGPAAGTRTSSSGSDSVPAHGVLLAILIFSGLLTFQATLILPVPSGTSFFSPTPSAEVQAYVNTVRALTWASMILVDFAVALSVVLSFWISSKGSEVSEAARRGMHLFSAVLLGVWLVMSPFLLGIVLATVRYYP